MNKYEYIIKSGNTVMEIFSSSNFLEAFKYMRRRYGHHEEYKLLPNIKLV